jgi:hypothetical protein
LTSVGLNDLDSILGGGQLLGSSILLEEDRLWTRDLALTLVRYWCAEVSFCSSSRCLPFDGTANVLRRQDRFLTPNLSFPVFLFLV